MCNTYVNFSHPHKAKFENLLPLFLNQEEFKLKMKNEYFPLNWFYFSSDLGTLFKPLLLSYTFPFDV